MPGFFITNKTEIPNLKNYNNKNCINGCLRYNEWTIKWNVLNKYLNDKLFFQNEEYIIILDGVILNKSRLIKKYACANWCDTVIKMIEKNDKFFSELRGVFSGAVLYKKDNKWTIFTDQCGAHIVMYYYNNGNIAFGSQLNYFADWMKFNNIDRKIDDIWLKEFLKYGYTVDKRTIIDGVQRIYPGCYLIYDNVKDIFINKIYFRINKKVINRNINIDEAIEKLDYLFSCAIKDILSKDEEYGYKTLVDVSGGLDSRMNIAVSAKINQNQVFGLTYSQRNSLDNLISDKVIEILKIDSIFYPLDNASCLMDIDELVFMNNGFNYYLGITGGKKLLSILDINVFGIEIWGLLGDIYEGAMVTDGEGDVNWNYNRFRTSKKFDFTLDNNREEFCDNEILWFYVRGMLAGMNTGFIRQNFVEPITPYGNVEFMEFCFSLPYEMRVKQHIYRQWMIKKYPEMANIKYSGTGLPVSLHDKIDYLKILPRRIKNRIYRATFGAKKEWSMNPLDIWYQENIALRNYIQNYYKENIELLDFDESLKKDVEFLFTKGNMLERSMALTLLSAVKQFI